MIYQSKPLFPLYLIITLTNTITHTHTDTDTHTHTKREGFCGQGVEE
jgi:hypothetical protein